MPSVLHVSQPLDGGVPRYVAALAARQAELGWDVRVLAPAASELHDLVDGDVPSSTWEASRSPGPSTANETRTLRRLVGEYPCDVLHLHSSKAGLAGRLAMRGRMPTLFQPHGWSFDAVTGVLSSASAWWERFGARWATTIVCVSDGELANGRRAGIPAARMRVVENGVDDEYFRPATPDERAQARRSLGLASDGSIAVSVGRVVEAKGQPWLAAVWPRVRAAVPDAELVLVGDGPARRHISGEGIRLVGAADDVRPWLAAADVFVLASRTEAMPLSVLEAMACGLPVVAFAVGGLVDLLDAGLVGLGDAPAFVDALVKRLRDPGTEGAGNRTRIERNHRLADRLDDLIAVADAATQRPT